MGKRQHQKDKMYLTCTEWSELYGGKKLESLENEQIKFKRLPYECCCITLKPFEHPCCDMDGNIYNLVAIQNFLKRFKVNPVTGKHLTADSLIKLNFHKNADGEFHCPVLFKTFTKNSHIVAIAPSGNVYCWEAIYQLNIKTKNLKDLIDGTPFTRKDIIDLQDSENLEKFDISKFYYIKYKMLLKTDDDELEYDGAKTKIKSMNIETRETLTQLENDFKPQTERITHSKPLADKFNAAHYSTGAVAASFTSTAIMPVSKHEPAIITESLVIYDRVKSKGYVRLTTNFGFLNFELYCDLVPKACENFITHCSNGYYNGTTFHRSIRNFMVQGGDPSGSGNGGRSIWGKKFEDEFKPNLSHSTRGILSMANSGPNTNASQLSCKHLDGKHTVFGKLVGGMETLYKIEQVEVDNKDRPIENIIIESTEVFVDPFKEVAEKLYKERAEELTILKKKNVTQKNINQPLKAFRTGVGKYLNINFSRESVMDDTALFSFAGNLKNKISEKTQFNDFSAW